MRSKNILMTCPSPQQVSPSSASYICVFICLPFHPLQLLVGQILEVWLGEPFTVNTSRLWN